MKHSTFQVFKHFLSVPFIWFLLIPIIILDISAEMYQNICFRLYGIPLVQRSQYIKIDRHKLQYLRTLQKINCAYCGYANGSLHYFSEIAAQTEKYWCAIQHEKDPNFKQPKHHKDFEEYDKKRTK